MRLLIFLTTLLVLSCQSSTPQQSNSNNDFIQPYSENPRYWQYKEKPVLLLGATNNDNLFQSKDVEAQLDTLAAIGGNYIRNTMSSRDEGDLWPYFQQKDSLYDLDKWNQEYWQKFDQLLKLAYERDIIVQIEVWDRFDFSRDPWQENPFNPEKNINYNSEEIGLLTDYPKHPSSDLQPFFHILPGMPLYDQKLDKIKDRQEKLIDKMLEYSLNYPNVLYCMNNETTTPKEWGQYWINFIQTRAKSQNKTVFTTDMFDEFFKPQSCKECQEIIENPEIYGFMDVSQINSRNTNQAHWDTLQWILAERDKYNLRPVNCTKIYGATEKRPKLFGLSSDGIERFYRNIIGGAASSRHHRPPSGNGQNTTAKASIKAIRKLETLVKLWDTKVRMDLLSEREEDEAYLSKGQNGEYVLYFTQGGSVILDLTESKNSFALHWISTSTAQWGEKETIKGGQKVEIQAPDKTGWIGVLAGE